MSNFAGWNPAAAMRKKVVAAVAEINKSQPQHVPVAISGAMAVPEMAVSTRLDIPAFIRQYQTEKQAQGDFMPSEQAIEDAMQDIDAELLAQVEQLQAEGRIQEAIDLLMLGTADAMSAIEGQQQSDAAEEEKDYQTALQADIDRQNRNVLLIGGALLAVGIYIWGKET